MDKRRVDDGTVVVGFELPSEVEASTVSVVGEFNGWTDQAHPLHRLDDGSFRTEIKLPAGDRWTFRYLVDGQRWENDWAADDYVPNGLGQDNSVVDLTHPEGLPLIAALEAERVAGLPSAGAPSAEAARPGPLRRWWRRLTDRRTATPGTAPVVPDAELVGSPS